MTALIATQHIPLSNAYLCEDCHCIGNCAERCPACASEALMGLAGVLNREESSAVQWTDLVFDDTKLLQMVNEG